MSWLSDQLNTVAVMVAAGGIRVQEDEYAPLWRVIRDPHGNPTGEKEFVAGVLCKGVLYMHPWRLEQLGRVLARKDTT